MQRIFVGFAVVLWLAVSAMAQTIHGREGITLPPPPAVEAVPVADNYFGTKISDSYRWLEDSKSPETRAFIDAQNAYTGRYLKQARIRPQVEDDLDALEHVSRWTMPFERDGVYFFQKRLAGEEQASIYVRRGWAGKDERLIDPARLSRDPNTSVELEDVSRDGALVAYHVRLGGADEATIRVAEARTGKVLEDELPSGRYFSVSFSPDGKALYYARSDRQGTLLFEHVLGARISQDKLLFGHEI
jgi:prolyl oligopeptidase